MYSGKTDIRHGEKWQYKDSVLICGDCLKVFSGITADIIYTDPPWNEAILKAFYKYSGYDGLPFLQLTRKLAEHIATSGVEIWIEMGLQHAPLWSLYMDDLGLDLVGEVDNTYGTNGVYKLMLFSRFLKWRNLPASHAMKGAISRLKSIAREGETFYDPCAGEGYFILPMLQSGMTVLGAEIIPDKFASMLNRLHKAGFDFIKTEEN